MLTPSLVGRIVSAATAVVVLANCSATGSSPTMADSHVSQYSTARQALAATQTKQVAVGAGDITGLPLPRVAANSRKDWVDVARVNARGGNEIMVADAGASFVLVYGADGRVNAILHEGLLNPYQLATDADGTLYVANFAANNVLVYKKPYNKINLILDDPNELDTGVAVSAAGIVGVTNDGSTTGGFGNVNMYAKGAKSACVTGLSSPELKSAFFATFDASGNLFLDGLDPLGATFIGEVSGGCNATKIVRLTTKNTLGQPGGIEIVNGHLLVVDQTAHVLFSYNLPSRHSLGSPTATTRLNPNTDPVAIAMNNNDKSIWIADATEFGTLTDYAYPTGTVLKSGFANGAYEILGLAVNPAASP